MITAYIYDLNYVGHPTDESEIVRIVAIEYFSFPRLQSLFPAPLFSFFFFVFSSILNFYYSNIHFQSQKTSNIEVVDCQFEQKILPEFKCQKNQQHQHPLYC